MGEAADTRHGTCNPARPARVNDQSPTFLKVVPSILSIFDDSFDCKATCVFMENVNGRGKLRTSVEMFYN